MLLIMGREARRINENEEENNILISAWAIIRNSKNLPGEHRGARRVVRGIQGSRSRTCHKQIYELWLIMLALQFGASLILPASR
ncbi:MAG: hypothetical protein WC556_07795 [Candidatus Methanoperedens sp.]